MAILSDYEIEQLNEEIAKLRGDVDRLNEILQMFDGPVPDVLPSSGFELFSVLGQPNYLNVAGLQMGLTGSQAAFFPGNTANSASLTSLASSTIPANDADVGAVYEIEVWGNGSQGTTVHAPTFSVVLGGNTLATVNFGTGPTGGASANFRFWVAGRAICHATGASGTWTTYINAGVAQFGGPVISVGNANFASAFSCESTGTQTLDTTAAQTLGVSAQWDSVATTVPSLTSRVAMFKRIV